MKTVEVEIQYDDQPEEINEKWRTALLSIGIDVSRDLEPANGNPVQRYEVSGKRLEAADELAKAVHATFGPTKDKTGNERDELDTALSNYYQACKNG